MYSPIINRYWFASKRLTFQLWSLLSFSNRCGVSSVAPAIILLKNRSIMNLSRLQELSLLYFYFILYFVYRLPIYAERIHLKLVFWNSIHQEVASDSFCFLINYSWLLVFILFFFSLFFSGFNMTGGHIHHHSTLFLAPPSSSNQLSHAGSTG